MIQFTKLQGNGNDFIIIDEYHGEVVPDNIKPVFSEQYCDRRFGIGADGVLFLSQSDCADIKMRLFQPDRSEAEMCGNGIRCLVKYALDKEYISTGEVSVETMVGIMPVHLAYQENRVSVRVNMGHPLFDRGDIPAKGDGEFINVMLEGMTVSALNTGVPHCVIFTEDLKSVDIDTQAPLIRYHDIFPEGTNVNFVNLDAKGCLNVRTYERGIEGETLSCGTGSVASAVIANRLGLTGSNVTVKTPGGILKISFIGEYVYMEGTASAVFSGTIL